MSKTSTVFYYINNLSSNIQNERFDSDLLFGFEDEFKDVVELLDTLEFDVSEDVVDSVLKKISM